MGEYHLFKEQRRKLRQMILTKRREISDETAYESGLRIAEYLKAHSFFAKRRVVGSYLSTRGEISTAPINDYLMSYHDLALPYIDVHIKGQMNFYAYKMGDLLYENRFHILEPDNKTENYIMPDAIDAMLVPLVAFDKKGNRLGMGGGYYDRILKKVSVQCLIVGVAYDMQYLDKIPIEGWDMPLDEVIKPTRHYIFNNDTHEQ